GPDRVTTLEAAVRRLVEPGQTIYAGAAHGRPNALVRELVRQWWGRSPGWTLALTGIGSPWSALIIGGLVKRLLTTFVGEGYPFAGVDGPTADAAASLTATRIGFVRALVPDVALFHAWAADRAGNVLAAAPLNENFYAAMAARRGAIVTVEKIVTTDFIRRHAG